MNAETPLDYAVFELSPKRSRYELFVSSNGHTEKLASGLVKPFVSHLQFAEEQVALPVQSIKLEVQKRRNAEAWFTKGTLERFVRFVTTPEVLEIVNTFDAEMSQLEAARRIYSQEAGDHLSGASGRDGRQSIATADATKQELLRAMEVRLIAVRHDLTSACARASAADYNPDTVSELQLFADNFGAHRLNEACSEFTSVCQRRPDLINHHSWKTVIDDRAVRSSTGSDMSLDDPTEGNSSGPHQPQSHNPSTCHPPNSSATFPSQRDLRNEENLTESDAVLTIQQQQPTRRLSVQDRINLFENKQKENSGGKSSELRRLSSDVSASSLAAVVVVTASEKAVLRRWSGASDMSIDLSFEKKDIDSNSSPVFTPPASDSPVFINKAGAFSLVAANQDAKRFAIKPDLQTRVGVGSAQTNSKDQVYVKDQFQSFSFGKTELVGVEDQTDFEEKLKLAEGLEARSSLKTNVELASENKNYLVNQLHSQSVSDKLDNFAGLKVRETSPVQSVEVDSLEESGIHKMMFHRQGIASEQLKTSQSSTFGIRNPALAGKKVSDENCNAVSVAPTEQFQRVRQTKGNQELNDELKLKANELEKLFAEHKLRDHPTSSRRTKPTDMQMDQAPDIPHKASSEMTPEPNYSNIPKFNFSPVLITPITKENGDSMKQVSSESTFSDDSKGRFYDTYMQKRDAKLREEWGINRAEKEAKMKAMHDSLERSGAELRARIAGSTEKQDSMLHAHLRTEKLRSFNLRSNIKSEQLIEYVESEEEEDISDLREPKPRFFNETSLVDGLSKTTKGRKILPGRNLPSSSPRKSTTPIPRPSVKASSPSAGRRRAPSENLLAQSVPNFSDFRKEKSKPSSGVSKITPRIPVRINARGKNNTDDIFSTKEDKPRRSKSLRKSSVEPLNSDGIVFTPVKFEDSNDHSLYGKLTKHVESKPFLKKGNGIGPGVAKLKASMAPQTLKNDEDTDGIIFEPEGSVDMVKEEEDEEYEMAAEDFPDVDNDKPSASQESDNSASEKVEASTSPSQVDPASVAEFPASVPLAFHALGSLHKESPGESPMSWNLRMHNSFSYHNEISDIDAYVDSTMGSPWNSNSLAQTEADDAARMRKKWGSAQKPIMAATSSNTQSRKDMTKGFKRLLKFEFGRKTRGTESLADWISATTSEGDDDTEDGRDPTNRSSDDLRKSRMGFSQSHPCDYGFNESELYTEQVQPLHSSIPAPPANFKLREAHLSGSSLKAARSSFFSLSSFRSKGSDSKLK